MNIRLSKEITDRLKVCLFLLAAIAEQGPEVAAAALGGGETREASGVLRTFKTFGRKLKAAIDRAVALDRKLHDLRSEEAALRRDRDKMKRRLGRLVVGLRRMVRGAYVAPDLVAMGLDAPNPKESTAFLRKVELIEDKLGDEGRFRMLGSSLFRSPQDPEVHREELKPEVRALKRTLDQLAKVRRRIDAMLVKRGEAVAEYDRIFLRTARMFEDLCRLAGYDALAERVRPSTRNPGRTEQKVDVTDEVVADAFGSGAERQGEIDALPAGQGADEQADVPMAAKPAPQAAPRSLATLASRPSRASPEE